MADSAPVISPSLPSTQPASLAFDAARVTERAAIAASGQIGRGDEMTADRLAIEAMRRGLDELDIAGRIVIGEGEAEGASVLHIGAAVGTGRGSALDVALDPLEGATLTAKGMSGALSVLALSIGGGLMKMPDAYMDKIAIGPGYPTGTVDLDRSPEDNVRSLADAKGVAPQAIAVCVLDRPRNARLIAALREVGARVTMISDGDIAGVIHTTEPDAGIDMYLGSGGAPEGVLAAAALKCVGGLFQGRLVWRNDDERARAVRMGLQDPDRKYDLDDLVSRDVVFAATGVTRGDMLDGVVVRDGQVSTHTLVMDSASRTIRRIRTTRPI